MNIALQILSGTLAIFVLSSLVEYIVHRLMHKRILLGKIHIQHHREGTGQGFLKEFKDYFLPTSPIMVAFFLVCWLAFDMPYLGVGCVAGGIIYGAFAAYAHQAQHEYPELVFWMKRPVHHIHHEHKMWFHNFGIATDVWDRLFGTYKYVEWKPARPIRLRRFLQISWLRAATTAETIPPVQ